MSRFAPIITLEVLKAKLQPILDGDDFPYEMTPKIDKDLSKINFDWENYDYENQGYNCYPCGYEVLSNGLPVLFINAGGDWEIPICFCLYWDGKAVRGYIPTEGNIFNVKEKCAYGSEDNTEEYEEEYDKMNEKNGDPEAIRKDVMNRIVIR